MTRPIFLSVSLILVGALALDACIPAGDGVMPPENISYFPVGLAVDQTGDWLYVVNSDFDLQYNQGIVQSLEVSRISSIARQPCSRDADCAGSPNARRCDSSPSERNGGNASFFCVDAEGPFAGLPCGPFPENSAADRAVSPGRCGPVSLSKPADGGAAVQTDSVAISAFATDALFVSRPEDPTGPYVPSSTRGRLFLPVRGDSSLHFIDVDGGKFVCGQDEKGGACAANYRVLETATDDPEEPRETPAEPYGIASTVDGRYLVISHQSGGKASAFINDWSTGSDGLAVPPRLVSIEEKLPSSAMGIAAIPRPAAVDAGTDHPNYQSGFLVTFRNDPSVHLLRFFAPDLGLGGAAPAASQPLLFDVAKTAITVNSTGTDSRGIAVDDSARRAAEASCGDDLACLTRAATVPFDVYVANRSPNSLLVGRTQEVASQVGAGDLPTFHDNVPLTQGPSRVVVGHVVDPQGELALRIFVLCFDSALIYVYDPQRRVVESEIYTGRGPHSLAFAHGAAGQTVAYVGHFTDSYVAVVSIDQRHPQTFGSTLAILGKPTPPRASK